jgi:excinuclease ABC subunit A
VNTLFVLDEPSVGLHPRDTERLVRILQQLRDAGNTVVVVEHEASVMRAADQIVDLGPGHGATGGEVMFQGSYREILKAKDSLTGQYLSGRKRVELPERRSVNREQLPGAPHMRISSRNNSAEEALALNETPAPYRLPSHVQPQVSTLRRNRKAPGILTLSHATKHNLENLTVEIPLGRFVCVTGVSGSGKTTLVREVLLPALAEKTRSGAGNTAGFERSTTETQPSDTDSQEEESLSSADAPGGARLLGAEQLGSVVLVDQAILGKTPRSNPAVYIGAFDDIREFFAQSEPAKQRGLAASAFSFNSSQGQCERCRGAGFEKIEMQFLSDVFIRCPDCNGQRYRAHILEIKVAPKAGAPNRTSSPRKTQDATRNTESALRPLSIAGLLDSTVDEAITFLTAFPESRPAQRAAESLRLLAEVGLGYLKLGQPINTLSGGESQRLKLVRHLAEAALGTSDGTEQPTPALPTTRPTLFLFDEPTTGLHFEDVRVLLRVFQRLVDAGHSVLVIEHNLDVIKSADWLIDLGPDAGDEGGRIVAAGTPEEVASNPESHTGRALTTVLNAA